MRLLSHAAGILVLALFIAGLAPAADTSVREQIDEIVRPLIDEERVVGMVVGIVTPDDDWVRGYGTVSRDSKTTPSGDTIFEIGSITKTFTALLLADMARDGLVALDAPVQRYLPEGVTMPRQGNRQVTLAHLATHTAGLPRLPRNMGLDLVFLAGNPYARYTPQRMYDSLTTGILDREIGKTYLYSNYGAGLLGQVLADRAGVSYGALIEKRIAGPLGMKDTATSLTARQKERLAQGYNTALDPVLNWDFDAMAGAGAIRSTADDMLIYLEANIGSIKTDLAPAMETCHKPRAKADIPNTQIGLGWLITQFGEGDDAIEVIWHNGETGGYHSWAGFVKKSGTGVVVLCNTARNIDDVGIRILVDVLN